MITVQENISLAPYTTFKIGGTARYFVEVSEVKQIIEAYEWSEEKNVPLFILAGGSNVLFSDQGFPGLVLLYTGERIQIQEQSVIASGSTSLGAVINAAHEQGLGGMENMSGIPGSLGGAVRGNAGAFGVEIKDILVSAKAVNTKTGLVKEFSNAECAFVYRMSFFKKNPEWIVVEATLSLQSGRDPKELHRIGEEIKAKREAKHPQDAKCAGSFFMNPETTDKKILSDFEHDSGTPSRNGKIPAGWLITQVGLRGKQIGGAQMSCQHPNYLVNTGSATAEDVVMLASIVKTRVRNQFKIQLKEEIQFVGF